MRVCSSANARLQFHVIASAAKQSILSLRGKMDCFASLAMTARATDCFAERVGWVENRSPDEAKRNPGFTRHRSRITLRSIRATAAGIPRHCEPPPRHCERSEAIHSFFARRDGLLRFARNDGAGYGLLRGACHRARIRATRWLAMTARAMDCFAEPAIGRAFARPVGSQWRLSARREAGLLADNGSTISIAKPPGRRNGSSGRRERCCP